MERSGRYRSWMSYIRDLGRWLKGNGANDAYVLSEAWKAPFVPARPYLLSRHEIDLFFKAAAALEVPSPWRWQAAAFFTLMHSCGMRTGEVRLLSPEAVDLREGHIDVLWSKGNRSRRLPLTGQGRHRGLGGLRAGIGQAVRHVPSAVLRFRRRQPRSPPRC